MDSSDEDDQMRQMMGFSSFGGNKPKHKPKRSGAPSAPGTSTNLTPLGQRSIPPTNTTSKDLPPRPPVDMSSYEQISNGEGPQWIAARLPDTSPFNGNKASNGNTLTAHESQANLISPFEDPSSPADLSKSNAIDQPTHSPSSLNVQAPPFHPTLTSTSSPTNPIPNKPPPTTFSKNDIRSDPTYWTSIKDKHTHEDLVGYTSPWTGAEMTRAELKEYSQGKETVLPSGEVVVTFFKPSFVEVGIWDEWERPGKRVR